ncbi:MAG: RcnB family protein [Rhizomicrobium sp.]
MKRIISLAVAIAFAFSGIAQAAPGDDANKRPTTKPAFGQRPVVTKPMPRPPVHRPPAHKPPAHRPPSYKPPSHRPPIHRPPAHRPPVHRPPIHRPIPGRPGGGHFKPPGSGWHKPRPSQWWWRGKWITRIRINAFRYPSGWSYRYWYIGDVLPALFLNASYYYDDISPLGLETPPPGYRWVRYGPDLLLVNLATGSVEEVAYGVFY